MTNVSLARQWTVNQNCYGYAMDKPEYDSLFPGELAITRSKVLSIMFAEKSRVLNTWDRIFLDASPQRFKEITLAGAKADGLIEVSKETILGKGARKLGLYFGYASEAPDVLDFHWIREEENGLYSFKVCAKLPQWEDDLGRSISNPEEAYFENYEFWGYMYQESEVTQNI